MCMLKKNISGGINNSYFVFPAFPIVNIKLNFIQLKDRLRKIVISESLLCFIIIFLTLNNKDITKAFKK